MVKSFKLTRPEDVPEILQIQQNAEMLEDC